MKSHTPAQTGTGCEVHEVWVVRHGERQDYVDPTWPDTHADTRHDPPLTYSGMLLAHATGARIASQSITGGLGIAVGYPEGGADATPAAAAILCSPFLRTIQTASPIAAKLGIPIRIENGLAEGLREGYEFTCQPRMLPVVQVPAIMSSVISECGLPALPADPTRLVDTTYVSVHDFPTYPEARPVFWQRFKDTVDALLSKPPAPCLILVTHGYGFQSISEKLAGKPVEDTPGYCAVSHFWRDSSTAPWTVRAFADCAHTAQNNP
ncbi:histidine phosphatase family protein [Pelomyxa schiedti]|nr:histidine phosphatase family protein [Pelomyxa schiedti]